MLNDQTYSLLTRGRATYTERFSMRIGSALAKGLFAFYLLTSGVSAEAPRTGDHLSYYTYYKSKSGETVSQIAAKFGLAESSLLRMNPQYAQGENSLPEGSLLCVPQEKSSEAEPLPVKKIEKSKTVAAESKPVERKSKKKKASEEPDEDEWDRLAELATKGAPNLADARVTRNLAPASRMIGSDGRVVWIPAAKPKPTPKPKRSSRNRVELSSRKGKAIHGVLNTCRSYLGTPYVWGGEQPGGFDCSGYVQYVFAKHGYRLPRTADIQFNVGDRVARGEEKPGDLVFFETYAPGASHVGVYLGRGYFIHASSSRGVTIDRLATEFFAQRYLGAKRNKF